MKKLNKTTFIDVGKIDKSRPSERPPKSNWKIEFLKKGILALQHFSPKAASEIIWSQFTKPGKPKFTPRQQELLDKAEKGTLSYLGYEIVTYRWGTGTKKVLLSHGWNSKIADFRAMIEALVNAGYTVEGTDMKAHGNSEGKRTALPEMRDILKNFYMRSGPYEAVIGYSIGGLAAGVTLGELSKEFLPKYFFAIAAPTYTRYFFHEVIKSVGCNERVYEEMCALVNKNYQEPIDYFDIRAKRDTLTKIKMHLIYDEVDETVPFEKGIEMHENFPDAHFVHTKGLGHYKIISHPEITAYVVSALQGREQSILDSV